jgi:phosphatidylglycerophosphate synthase
MLDARLRAAVDPLLDRWARRLVARGWSADAMTIAGFLVGAAGCAAIAGAAFRIGLLLILANRIMDGLDGAIARRTRATDLGGFLDIVSDFLIYAAVPFAFALADPANALAASFLILSFVGTGTTFLAFAAIAARRGRAGERNGLKSLYYIGGLTEGSETILAFVLMCLVPRAFPVVAYLFGMLCWLTTIGRIRQGFLAFDEAARRDVTPPDR